MSLSSFNQSDDDDEFAQFKIMLIGVFIGIVACVLGAIIGVIAGSFAAFVIIAGIGIIVGVALFAAGMWKHFKSFMS